MATAATPSSQDAPRPAAAPRHAPQRVDAVAPPAAALRAGLWAASRSLRVLGRARYVFADALGLAIYATSPARARQCASNHLRLEPSLTSAQARARARGSFREFMRTSFDFVWEYAVPPERMERYFTPYNVDAALRALADDGGCVFALAHYGSWDVAAACALQLRLPITAVMTAVGTSDLATRVAAWARRHQDIDVLMTKGAATGLLRAVRRGRADAILCDIPDRGQRALVDFCGGKVAFSTAPAWIARTMHVPLFPVHCWRENGRYRLRVYPAVPINGTDDDVMQRVATVLEAQIRRMPTQWYPFGRVYKD